MHQAMCLVLSLFSSTVNAHISHKKFRKETILQHSWFCILFWKSADTLQEEKEAECLIIPSNRKSISFNCLRSCPSRIWVRQIVVINNYNKCFGLWKRSLSEQRTKNKHPSSLGGHYDHRFSNFLYHLHRPTELFRLEGIS